MNSILFALTTMALSVAALQDNQAPPGGPLPPHSGAQSHEKILKAKPLPIRSAKPLSPEAFAPVSLGSIHLKNPSHQLPKSR